MIKAVLFDYGGVLTPGGFDGAIKKLFAGIYGVGESEIEFGSMVHDLMDGSLSTEKFFDRMNAKYPGKQKATGDMLIERSPESLARAQPVHDLAKRLRDAGIRTGIFSNVAEFLARPHFKLGDYDAFDPVLLSYRDKMAKPDIGYYKFALKTLDLPADEVLFIDDKERNLIPARKLGMHTLKFENPNQAVNDTIAFIKSKNVDFETKAPE